MQTDRLGAVTALGCLCLPVLAVSADPNPPESPRFSCQVQNGQHVVMYHPKSQPGKSFPWAIPSNMGGGWSADRRCQEISRRLEAYRPDGLLEMRTSTENGYNIVCATTEKNPTCRIVFTVPPNQDPTATRDRVFANLTTADSGQQTTGVNTLVGSNRLTPHSLYLKPFLDPSDGGTMSTAPRLDPNNFR